MAVASKADLQKKQDELNKHLKKLEDPDTGKQKEKALITMLRGAIRESWMISPVKLAYYEMGRVADTDPSTLTKWKMQCECCGEWYKADEIEIDHLVGNQPLTKIEDFPEYYENILNVEFKDLQRISKYRCHRIKSHKEKQGFTTLDEACLDKIVIFLVKHVETKVLTEFLTELGIVPESSAPKRKKQLATWLDSLNLDYNTTSHFLESCDYLMRMEAKRKKAKRFNMSKVGLTHLLKWRDFWDKVGVHPKTTLKVITDAT